MMSRACVLAFAVACLVLANAARAQEHASVERAEVVDACVEETVLPDGNTIGAGAIRAYCQCAIDRSAEIMSPVEFDVFARFGVSRVRQTPPPSAEELHSLETAEFARRAAVLRGRLQQECVPLLRAPPG